MKVSSTSISVPLPPNFTNEPLCMARQMQCIMNHADFGLHPTHKSHLCLLAAEKAGAIVTSGGIDNRALLLPKSSATRKQRTWLINIAWNLLCNAGDGVKAHLRFEPSRIGNKKVTCGDIAFDHSWQKHCRWSAGNEGCSSSGVLQILRCW
jgi:hypothetical protein